jgi:hypothetical protein
LAICQHAGQIGHRGESTAVVLALDLERAFHEESLPLRASGRDSCASTAGVRHSRSYSTVNPKMSDSGGKP